MFGVEGECKYDAFHTLVNLFLSQSLLRIAVYRNLFRIIFPLVVYIGWKRLCYVDDLDLQFQRLGDFGGCGFYGFQSFLSVGGLWGVD